MVALFATERAEFKVEKNPIFKVVDDVLVRVDSDTQDPSKRYSLCFDAELGQYLREFTAQEEQEADERAARWLSEAPQRALEEERQAKEAEAFRASLRYETRYVAFVDILGWTATIRDERRTAERTEQLGLALNMIRQYSQSIQNVGEWFSKFGGGTRPGDLRLTHFSDCLAISTTPDMYGRDDLINALDFLTNGLLQQGFLLRGGVTVGQIYHHDSMVFGPAFLEAYELESQSAIYPRIVLNPRLADSWGQGNVYIDKDGNELGQARTWRLSHDGYRFFDFLQPFAGSIGFAGSPVLLRQRLAPCRAILQQNLTEQKTRLNVWQKYAWLANYFNKVCEEHSGHGIEPVRVFDVGSSP